MVGSDSGRIAILQFDPQKSRFVKLLEETYGKSGCRRIVPGQYLAVDPKGRAVMISAIEKQKLVYIMNRTCLDWISIVAICVVEGIVCVLNHARIKQCRKCHYY